MIPTVTINGSKEDKAMLTTPCEVITDWGEAVEIEKLLRLKCLQEKALGFAANQIGYSVRIMVMITSDDEMTTMFNPELVKASTAKMKFEEFCYSAPQYKVKTNRPKNILVKYQDSEQNWHEKELQGKRAICFQHELDHLNGELFVHRGAVSRA